MGLAGLPKLADGVVESLVGISSFSFRPSQSSSFEETDGPQESHVLYGMDCFGSISFHSLRVSGMENVSILSSLSKELGGFLRTQFFPPIRE